MPTAVTLLLPDQLYEQATRLADQQRQELDQLLVDEITKIIAAQTATISDLAHPLTHDAATGDEIDAAVERERTAYVEGNEIENYYRQEVIPEFPDLYLKVCVLFKSTDQGRVITAFTVNWPKPEEELLWQK